LCFETRAAQEHVVGFGTDFVLKSNLKPYISAEIFRDCIRTVFLSNLPEIRALYEFAEEMGVLLMDNWSNHITCVVI
jgi:hypothetical protein